MNARTEPELLHQLSNAHLDGLEEETIFILREVAAAFERPALLFLAAKILWSCSNAPKKPSSISIKVGEFLTPCS